MNAITMRITDSATPALELLRDKMSPKKLHAGIATAVKRLVQAHLLGLGRNKRNWPTTNFWPRAAKSTSADWSEESATVSINQIGVAQRYYGGWIKPQTRRALTIPISPEAYGKTASDFPEAFLVNTKKGAYIVQRENKRTNAHLQFLFKLSKGVYQDPDPNVLPAETAIAATAINEVERNLEAALS